MKIKTAWAFQSLALCIVFNVVFAAVILYMASGLIDASRQWIAALGASLPSGVSPNAHAALVGLSALIAQARGWVKPVLFLLASAFTLLGWFFLFLTGGRQMRRVELKVESQMSQVEGRTLPSEDREPEGEPVGSES
ncbi:MAG: hypothetical protein ACP5SH_26130 [Syntrophobacteraceae bacterium]